MVSVGSAILWLSNWETGDYVLEMIKFHFNLSHGNFYYIAQKKASLNNSSDLEVSLAHIF